jgi:hypothetical protein
MLELDAQSINKEKNNHYSADVFSGGQVKWSMWALCDMPASET